MKNINHNESASNQTVFIARRAVDLKDIKNGYEEHVYGEYIGYMRKFNGLLYSLDQRALFGSDLKVKKKLPNALFFGFWLISRAIKLEKTVLVLVYPSVMRISYITPLCRF